jgi:cytochrome P450
MPLERTCPFDPPSELGELRAARPLTRLRQGDTEVGWLATSYRFARSLLLDRRLGMSRQFLSMDDPKIVAQLELVRTFSTNFLEMDPPEHTRYRSVLAERFTGRRVEEHAEQIKRVVEAQVDVMERCDPPVDFVTTFASPVAARVHCVMLGVHESEAPRFVPVIDGLGMGGTTEGLRRAFIDLGGCINAVVQARRREPRDDLISYVAHETDLTDEEIFRLVCFMSLAGISTMSEAIAFITFALLARPDQMEKLRRYPSLISGAVDELLRYTGTFAVAVPRVALGDVELDGITIAKGDNVTISLGAANRDPAQYDDPDTFDVERPAPRHLGFGQGIHVCLGQHLARLELRVGLLTLIERLPELRLAVPVEEVPVHTGGPLYTLKALPVAW